MPISNIDISQAAPTASNLNQNEPTLKESDGVLLVANGRSEHPLQNEHCKPCLTVFQELQAKAVDGGPESQDLLKRAQAQMEQLQSTQINRLSVESKTPVPYASPKTQEASSVSLTSGARLRAANVARLRPDPEIIAAANQALAESNAQSNATATEQPLPNGISDSKPSLTDPIIVEQPPLPSTIDGTPKTGKAMPERASQALQKADVDPQRAIDKEPTQSGKVGAEWGGSIQSAPEQTQKSHGANDGHGHTEEASAVDQSPDKRTNDAQMTDAELDEIRKLQQRDIEVRTHEQAHKSAAGSHGGSISLSFKQGPDGKRYAVEGEVPVDLSAIADDPEATVAKMQQIHRAALAPAEPSSADRRVAAKASQKAAKARKEIAEASMKEDNPLKTEHDAGEDGKINLGRNDTNTENSTGEPSKPDAHMTEPDRSVSESPQHTSPSAIDETAQPAAANQQSKGPRQLTDADQSVGADNIERATLSRKKPLSAYAKVGARQYGGADQSARATLSMNLYG
jgi:hypothetical protein